MKEYEIVYQCCHHYEKVEFVICFEVILQLLFFLKKHYCWTNYELFFFFIRENFILEMCILWIRWVKTEIVIYETSILNQMMYNTTIRKLSSELLIKFFFFVNFPNKLGLIDNQTRPFFASPIMQGKRQLNMTIKKNKLQQQIPILRLF